MSIRISAIICTLNRASYLGKALQSLVEQTLPRDEYEVIVVDNGSSDNTKATVGEYQSTFKNLRYIYEPVLGLSQARNTGWRSSQAEYVAYLDDDAIACPAWLEGILHVFDSVNPTPGSVGGRITLIWEAQHPKWLAKELETSLGFLDWGDYPKFLMEGHQWLGGGNVAYKRLPLSDVGGFNTSLGRKGTNLLSNDEVFLRDRLRERNLKEYYDPSVAIQHHALANRMTKQWFYKRYYWQGISEVVKDSMRTHRHNRLAGVLRFSKILMHVIIDLLMYPLALTSESRRMVRTCSLYNHVGQMWTQARMGLGLLRT